MADSKISGLTSATTPLAGTEVLPIVQSGVTKQVSVANLTAGRSVSVLDLTASGGNVTLSSTYELNHLSAASPYTAVRIGASNVDVVLLRVGDAAAGTSVANSAVFGFSLTYMGTRSGNANTLSLFSDNQAGSQIEAVTVFQDGSVGIGTGGTITASTKLDVIGNVRTTGQLTSTVATGTAPFVVASTTRVSNLNVATAGTADTLTTARTINEVSFNGSANITVPRVRAIDDRTAAPADFTTAYATVGFGSWNNNNTSPYADYIAFRTWTDASGGNDNMVSFRKDAIGMRVWQQTYGSATAFATYKDVAFTDSSITGNAATATALQNTRTLWGQNFNGTANVTGALTSVGNITGTAGVTLTATAGTLGLVATGANVITASTNGSERMRIDSSGNVGIGTSSPTNTLSVAGNANITGNTTLGDASTDTVTVNGYMGVGGAGSSSRGISVVSTALTSTGQTGLYSAPVFSSSATTLGIALWANPSTAAASFTMQEAYGLYVSNLTLGAGSTVNSQYGIRISDQTQGTNNYGITSLVSSGSNKWNIYASGTANNAFAGNVRIGSTTAPTNALDVTGSMTVSGNTTLGDASTDTVTVNGYMGVGGAPNGAFGVWAKGTAQSGTTQYAFYSSYTGSTTGTSQLVSFLSSLNVPDSAYTVAQVAGLYSANVTKGASATITNQHGVYIADQTQGTNNYGITSAVSSGSNKWNIYASGTADNYFAGKAFVGTTTDQDGRLIVRSTGNNYTNSAVAIVDSANTTKLQMLQTTSGFFYMTVNGTDDFVLKPTESVFNESGADIDFRVESDTNTHALFVQGSDGNVGIGTSSPGFKLDVQGTTAVDARIYATDNATGKAKLYLRGGAANFSYETDASNSTTYLFDNQHGQLANRYLGGAFGYWQFYTAGSERMRINSSGSVGIGTGSPSVKLEVSGASSGATLELLRLSNTGTGANTKARLNFYAASTNYASITGGYGASAPEMVFDINTTAGAYIWNNNTTEQMRIDSAGNLGLGVTPSAWTTVVPAIQLGSAGAFLAAQGSSTNVRMGVNAYYNGGYIYTINGAASMYQQAAGVHSWHQAASGTAGNAISFTQAMTLNASGNLGIGTSSPASLLHINANNAEMRFSEVGTYYASLKVDSAGGLTIGADPGNTAANSRLIFAIDNTERMRITSAGDVGIGTTPAFTAGSGLEVQRAGTATLRLDSGTFATEVYGYTDGTGIYQLSGGYLTLGTNNTERLRITSTGDVGIGTSSPSAKLDVVGGVEATAFLDGPLYDSAFKRFTNPGGGIYTTSTPSVTGAIRITFPVGATNTMVKVTVKVYEYQTNRSFEIHFGGYLYSVGPSWANNPYAYIVGNPTINRQFTVRLGYDSTATKMVAYIGELASTWAYPQVYITEVQCGYGGFSANFATGWAVDFEATAFQNVTATISNPQVGYQAVAGDAIQGSVRYTSTTNTAGCFYGGTTTPTGTTRLNYSGYLYPTYLNLIGSADTTTAATHYFVEQSSDGYVRPKTIANVRTEIVTTAAVSAATAAGAIAFAAGSAAAPSIYPTGDTNTGIFFPAADTIAFSEGGAESMRIDSSGNVGIGTSSPSGFGNTGKLAVQTASSTNGIVATFANSGATGAAIQLFQNGVDVATIGMPANSGGITFAPSGTTERMRITSAGNIHTPAGATTMTDGFIYIPSAGGTPTGAATAITGTVPLYYDTTNNKLFVYNSSWQNVATAGSLPLVSTNANGVVYLNGSSQATTSTALQFNGTELGIGQAASAGIQVDVTTTALAQIRARATTNGVDSRLAANSSGLLGYVGTISNHDFAVYTNNTERARVTAAGVLQLSPVSGEGGELNLLNPAGGTVGGYVDVSTANNFRLWTGNLNATMQIGQLSSTGGNIQFFTEASEKMRLTAAGDLGIGVSSPSQKLHVNAGNIYVSNTVAGNAFCLVYNGSAAAGSAAVFALWNDNGLSANSVAINFYSSGSTIPNELRIANGANAPMTFYTNGSERMRITGGGNFLTTQAAHSTVNTSSTLTIAQVQSGIIVSTPATNITITLPTGTTLETYTTNMPVGFSFELTIILVTGSGGTDITIAANGNTFYPSTGTNVTTNGPSTLRFRKTATNTFSVYRLS